ncbi:dihydromonapterin reductase [Shewanella waksmanii]|uniref:dihydromonapterin reductase n=1 Tax=Shewanella waksmanii TaxID=213783 RepID=UPI00048A58FF|nr:dihydromonapterin reductase [Shewanella waksmanii]
MTKTVLITGVGKRIGLYLANAFIQQGWQVIGTYRSHYPSIDALAESGADLYCCDFTDNLQIQHFIEKVLAAYPQLDCVIHNASLWLPDNADLANSDIMATMMQVHVSAPYQINLAVAPLLQAAEQKSNIIHITDYVAEKGSKKHIAYAASKAAMENMSLSFASLLAPKVKVNSIAPALICFNEGDSEQYQQKARNKSLMQQVGGEHEMWDAIQYLLCSHYITGRSLPLDGGRHLK